MTVASKMSSTGSGAQKRKKAAVVAQRQADFMQKVPKLSVFFSRQTDNADVAVNEPNEEAIAGTSAASG